MSEENEDVEYEEFDPNKDNVEVPVESIAETDELETPKPKVTKTLLSAYLSTEEVEGDTNSIGFTIRIPTKNISLNDISNIKDDWDKHWNKKEIKGNEEEQLAEKRKYEKASEEFVNALISVVDGLVDEDSIRNVFSERKTTWTQTVDGPGDRKLRIGYVKCDYGDEDTELVGEDALDFLDEECGTGNTTVVHLWRSGLILQIDSSSESDLLRLNTRLQSATEGLGTLTNGISYTGDDVIARMTCVNYVLDKVSKSNLKKLPKVTDLKKFLHPMDIDHLLVAALASFYPLGYPVKHTCMSVNCKETYEPSLDLNGGYLADSLLSFRRCVHHDDEMIDDFMRSYMCSDFNTHSMQEVHDYIKHVNLKLEPEVNYVKLPTSRGSVIKINFKQTNAHVYERYGKEWIADVDALTKDLIAQAADVSNDKDQQLKQSLEQSQLVLELQKYCHWIDTISVTNNRTHAVRLIKDPKTIKQALERLTAGRNAKADFANALVDYKAQSGITYVGFDNYVCDKCNTDQVKELGGNAHKNVIPMNVLSYFFTIAAWRGLKTYQ